MRVGGDAVPSLGGGSASGGVAADDTVLEGSLGGTRDGRGAADPAAAGGPALGRCSAEELPATTSTNSATIPNERAVRIERGRSPVRTERL